MGIPYTKSPDDIKIEQFDLQNNRVLKYLKDITVYKFSVGDVLIREDKNYKDEWHVKQAQCGLPYKYVYAFENELGVGYIRRMSVTGREFVETPVCVTEFDPDQTRFKLDPDYADHLMMGDEESGFDMKSDYKAVRRKKMAMHRANDKIRVKTDTYEDAIAFLKSLKPGDQLWYGWSRNSIKKDPFTVVSVHIAKNSAVDTNRQTYRWQRDPDETRIEFHDPARKSAYNNGNLTEYVDRVMEMWWYKTRPQFFDEIL